MYSCNDLVMYGIHGVCQITDIEQRTVDGKRVSYYILSPIDQPGAVYYVPTHNPVAVAKLRPILSRDEFIALMHSEAIKQDAWIADEGRRKLHYKSLITSGDREALLQMICTLYEQKQLQTSAGRKFHLCDENFLRDAEKLLSSECAHVMGITLSEATAYIRLELKK